MAGAGGGVPLQIFGQNIFRNQQGFDGRQSTIETRKETDLLATFDEMKNLLDKCRGPLFNIS
jgi:hypothetical protein